MTHHPVISSILLWLAVGCAIVFVVGLAIMRDAFQRLHFATPIVSFSATFIAIAVWLENRDPAARVKVILITVILVMMNAVLSQMTARAVRIRDVGHWPVTGEEAIGKPLD